MIQLIILQPLLFYLFHKLLSLFPTYYTLQFSFSQSAFHRTGTMSRLWVTVHRQAFSELKMPYDTVVAADFADLECEASAKSVTGTRYEWTVTPCEKSFDRFRNLLIILSRLCYTFIHSMSLRFVIVFGNSIISKPLVSCYFYASYYWIFKVQRHILMCEVWVNNLQRKGKLSWKRSKSV